MKSAQAGWQGGLNIWKLSMLIVLAGALLNVFIPTLPAVADTAPPYSLQFYGNVYDNGTLMGAGNYVSAKINGVERASAVTDAQGRYGYSPVMLVSCEGGGAINFYVNGVEAAENITCLASPPSQVNLHVTNAAIRTPVMLATILGRSENFTLVNKILLTGKTFKSADDRVQLTFANNTAVNLQGSGILLCTTEGNPAAAADNSSLVRAYSFTPSGATFSPAANMTLKYEAANLPAGASESGLYIAWYTGSAWEKLASAVNTASKEVSAPVSHFTTFAIRYAPPAPVATTSTATGNTTTTAATANTTAASANTTAAAATPAAVTSFACNILGSSGNVTVSGGAVTSAAVIGSGNGQVSLGFAAGTAFNLQGGQQIIVAQLASPPSPPAGARLLAAYSFGPDNASFSPPLTLVLKYNQADVPAGVKEEDLYIALLQGSTWTSLPSSVNSQDRTVTAQLSHFSTYALLGTAAAVVQPAAAPSITLSDLAVTPSSVKAGENVTVSIRLANSGSAEGTKTVVVKVNDKNESQKDVTLAAGKSQVLSFTLNKADPGTYKVAVESLAASFEVKPAGEAGGAGMNIPVLVIIGIGCLLVLVLVIVRITRRGSGD